MSTRDLIEARLAAANRKMGEASRDLSLTGDLALAMARQALADMDFAAAATALQSAYRQCRGYWAKASLKDAWADLREAAVLAREAQP